MAKNKRIRMKMAEYELTQYDLAKLLGVSEMTVYRRLRDELPEEEQDRICELIEGSASIEEKEAKEDTLEIKAALLEKAINEICLRCGKYEREHFGECEGCTWLKEKYNDE